MTLDQIFDLIADNFIFVAVVIGGLISMFGRITGGGQQQQEQRQNRPQRTSEHQQEKVDWREIFKQEETNPAPVKRSTSTNKETVPQHVSFEKVVVSRQQELQNQYEEMQRKREVSSRRSKDIQEVTVTELVKKDKLDLHLNSLSNKEAMKAVVWAEVLGRPRSRQPHATFVKKR